MAPPITVPNRDVENTPPSNPYVPSPKNPSGGGVTRYEPRWLKPQMFGARDWRDLEQGLAPTQVTALYAALKGFDRPQYAKQFAMGSTGTQFIRRVIDQVKRTVVANPPATETRPNTNADPNAYSPEELDAINNPGKAEPRVEERAPYVEPPVTRPGVVVPDLPPADTGGTVVTQPPSTDTSRGSSAFGRPSGATGVPVTNYFTDPNAAPTTAAGVGREWYFDNARGRWMQRLARPVTGQETSSYVPPPTPTQSTYGGYNFMYDAARRRYVRAGKIGARGPQFSSQATAPQFIAKEEWDRINAPAGAGGGYVKNPAARPRNSKVMQ